MEQLRFTLLPICTGKKTQRLTVTCSREFEGVVQQFANLTNTSVSELGHRYFIEGMQRDLGKLFMAEPHLDKTLRSLIPKNF